MALPATSYPIVLNLVQVNDEIIFMLSPEISKHLPSQGMNMIKLHYLCPVLLSQSSKSQVDFKDQDKISKIVAIEPDGKGSHWGRLPESIISALLRQYSELPKSLEITYEIINDWPKPSLPEDFNLALKQSHTFSAWEQLTSKSQWQFLRWINLSVKAETRAKRIERTINHMIKQDKKRPCCFDQTRCTDPQLGSNGKLIIN